MTTFSFSTGNPSNLTGGATASMTDISGSLTDLKTFINAGSITDTNVQAAGLTDTSLASPTNAVWRPVLATNGVITASLSTTACYFSTNGVVASGGAGSATAQGPWVPPTSADVAVTSKTTRMRVRIPFFVNAVAPGVNITWGLYPCTAFAGSGVLVITLGTVVAGSTATATAPTAGGSQVTSAGFDFSVLTAGNPYILGVVASGTVAVNSVVMSQPILEMRHT